MTQFTTQNNSRRRLVILLILGVLFLSPERGVRADPESQPERTADSEEVEGKVWDRLIRWCETTSYIPYVNPLSDESWGDLPESAERILRRARRCQDRVRREIPGAIRQCRADWEDEPTWSADDRHRISALVLERDCPGQFNDLWTRYNDCCAVIPGY